jgi:hypothetical protein
VSVFDRRPEQTIDVFHRLNGAKRCPHALRISGDHIRYLYDPVVLGKRNSAAMIAS